MSSREPSIERLLSQLGEARRDGVFSAEQRPYPWQTLQPEANREAGGRFAWVRIAAPLAAAAAVALVFVAPGLLGDRAVHEAVQDGIAVLQTDEPAIVADAGDVTTKASGLHCDFNGDGLVDGRDIQALVNRMKDADGAFELEAEQLQQCLLGS
jgi:hypothetical protein